MRSAALPNCVRRLKQISAEIERAERDYDLNKAAELKYGKLPALKKQLEEEEQQVESGKTVRCCATRSPKTRLPVLSSAGRVFRYSVWSRANARNCCIWTRFCISVSSARMKRSKRSPKRSSVRVRVSRTPTVRLVLSSSLARPVSVRPSLPRRWQRPSLTTRKIWCVSICRSTWRNSPYPV